MAEASDELGILRQNMGDAGCDEAVTQQGMEYAKGGEWDRLAELLSRQKGVLLRQVRAGQERIDCLDYLVYRINKRREN